ncbi:hypothetical protein [Nitrosospira briensis]|uniref:hypothetical protein n=1 Tax=Nitrosospira briensis TaxID=35799 RepID=UPI0008F3B909|nr:hypothetical protein [Nitrosospira briensis]SFO29707.1 hypothetical protein SAMN05216332_11014 [Nitrosospira briensis]
MLERNVLTVRMMDVSNDIFEPTSPDDLTRERPFFRKRMLEPETSPDFSGAAEKMIVGIDRLRDVSMFQTSVDQVS